MTAWVFHGTCFDYGDRLPDGSEPAELMEAIGPWVQDLLRMIDSEGAYARLKFSGGLSDQPWFDMQIFDIIKSKWCELRNAEMEAKYGKHSISGD